MKDKIQNNLKFVCELIGLRFQHLMMFRLGFWGPFFVDGSLFLVELMVFQAIYANVETLGKRGDGYLYRNFFPGKCGKYGGLLFWGE